jgi:[ribosomal protein S18]-alanine N-acetyltransferase
MSEETSGFVFRPMQESDITSVTAIDRVSFSTPWPRSAYFHELHRITSSRFYVLEKVERKSPVLGWRRRLGLVTSSNDQHTLIGYLGFYVQKSDAHISTIAVHPNWRGRGFGEFMLWKTLDMITTIDTVQSSSLEVRPSNQAALSLYKKYGYRRAGDHKAYYRDGEDAWLMVLSPLDARYRERLNHLGATLNRRVPGVAVCIGQNGLPGL